MQKTEISRRGLIVGSLSLIASPSIARASNLMALRGTVMPIAERVRFWTADRSGCPGVLHVRSVEKYVDWIDKIPINVAHRDLMFIADSLSPSTLKTYGYELLDKKRKTTDLGNIFLAENHIHQIT